MQRCRLTVVLCATALLVGAAGAALAQPGPAPTAAKQAPATPAKTSAAKSERMVDAYKREFAFLEAEKRALQQRLAGEKQAGEARIVAARGEIGGLQGQIVALSGEAERLEELLLDADRNLDTLAQSEDVGEDLLTRAQSTYARVGVKLPETAAGEPPDPAKELERLRFIFEQAPAALVQQAQLRVADGEYFDATGKKVSGRILHVGGIASYGLVDGAQGPLAPAGDERLKLWATADGPSIATALAGGRAPATLPIFLYESLEKGADRERSGKTFDDLMKAGGPVGWVIVGLGLACVLMMVARIGILAWASRRSRRLLAQVLAAIGRGELEAARRVAERGTTPVARVLKATLDNVGKDRGQIEDVVAEAVLHEQPMLSRFGTAVLVIAAVAPLLGLLGTVTGMIKTFEIITQFGTGNPKLLSGGISEALVTTELGLVVAIPALLFGHFLNGWSDRIRDGLDAAALAAVNRAAGLSPLAIAPDREQPGEPVNVVRVPPAADAGEAAA